MISGNWISPRKLLKCHRLDSIATQTCTLNELEIASFRSVLDLT